MRADRTGALAPAWRLEAWRRPNAPAAPAILLAMRETAATLGKKALAALVLLVAAYVLFKVVVGLVTGLVWVIVAVLAIAALVWAVRTL